MHILYGILSTALLVNLVAMALDDRSAIDMGAHLVRGRDHLRRRREIRPKNRCGQKTGAAAQKAVDNAGGQCIVHP